MLSLDEVVPTHAFQLYQRKAAHPSQNAKVYKHSNTNQTKREGEKIRLSGYLVWDWGEQGYLQVGECIWALLLSLYDG